MALKTPQTISEFWNEILKKILSQSLLVIVGFGLFYYVLIRGQKLSDQLIAEKDSRIEFFFKMAMDEHAEKAEIRDRILKETKEQYEIRLKEQKEHYERILDFYKIRLEKIGYIEKQYQN